MNDHTNNIFDMLDSSPSNGTSPAAPTSTEALPLRRSQLPLMKAGNGPYSSSSSVQKTSLVSRSRRRKNAQLQDLGFVNPGPKNLVNVANVPARRLKTRQPSTQDKPNSMKPLYDNTGLLVSDQTNRCDCNRLTCSGCFLPCAACQSPMCGLECRVLRTYTYEYRLYGTNQEIIQSNRTARLEMLARDSSGKKRSGVQMATNVPLDSSLTSMDWLPKIQIVEDASSSSTTTPKQLPPDNNSSQITSPAVPPTPCKVECRDVELPTATMHAKPPFSYVTLIQQAILSTETQRMTLNDIYQWIVDTYPYFRTALPKWKNSIRHNLSLNKCFKRMQRTSNDPGKGSYWMLDESKGKQPRVESRHRTLDPTQPPSRCLHPKRTSDEEIGTHGHLSSADESDVTVSGLTNPTLLSWDDLNTDLTASFQRFREQILDGPSTAWITPSETPSPNSPVSHTWNYECLPDGEPGGLFESVKLASNGGINWDEVDLRSYGEMREGLHVRPTHQQQERETLLTLASSISSFFDNSGMRDLAQHRTSSHSVEMNHLPLPTHHFAGLPVPVHEEAFDWDSLT